MAKPAYVIERITGLPSSERRAIVFLCAAQDGNLNARAGYLGLEKRPRYDITSRMEHWIGGRHRPDYHHGWDDPPYEACYVFKGKVQRVRQRFYGFRVHPQPESNRRFEVCVLCTYATKSEHETDKRELDLVVRYSKDSAVLEALRSVFPKSTSKEQR
jgi:hypothetical protein